MLLLVVRCQEIASKFIFKIFLASFGSYAPSALAIPGYVLKVRPLSNNLGFAPDD
jgi:hypothetical protein